jgi:predicted nucleic acid-binding protein
MKLIVDTSILVAALLRKSTTRKILFHPLFKFYAPEFISGEVLKHEDELVAKSGLTKHRFDMIMKRITQKISIVEKHEFEGHMRNALDIMGDIDKDDAPFIALALSFENDGIWSNDRHYSRQVSVRVWRTEHLVDELERLDEGIH